MMHGRGKSSEAEVAMTPANKAAQAAAESEEPRASAKGNAIRTDIRRTQSRERVTSGLDRIRQVLAQPALCSQIPKVGTVCGKAASTGLCGGRPVTRVPTATVVSSE